MSQDSESFLLSSHSNLLSDSPFLSNSHTGPGGDDLSISELSLSDRPRADDISTHETGVTRAHAGKLRDEKLQDDLLVLRRLNAAISSFNEALGDVSSQNERVAAQLQQTEALLNKYVGILSGSEEVVRLILDQEWQGGQADEDLIAEEQREAERIARQLAEERAAAAQREREKVEREEKERIERKEREQTEKERKERTTTRGGVRGVRGTRASMRGTRGVTRGAPPSSERTSITNTAPSAPRATTTRGIGRRT